MAMLVALTFNELEYCGQLSCLRNDIHNHDRFLSGTGAT